MNNLMMMLINAARGGGNPMQMLQQMAGIDPQAAQVLNILRGKNPQQVRSIVGNMARQRGTTIEQMAQQMGLPMK